MGEVAVSTVRAKRTLTIRHVNYPDPTGPQHSMHRVNDREQLLLAEVFDDVECHYHVQGCSRSVGKGPHEIAFSHTVDSQSAGRGDLFGEPSTPLAFR